MPALTPPERAPVDHADFHPTLSNFLDFVDAGDISVQPEIAIQELAGRGLGVVAVTHLRPGAELMWVPTSAILQPSSVPEWFVPLTARRSGGEKDGAEAEAQAGRVGMRTHALLASWIAFGECAEHEAWMATWPGLEDMMAGMPLCWPGAAKELRAFPENPRSKRWNMSTGRVKGLIGENGIEQAVEFAVLPWDVLGKCAVISSDSATPTAPSEGRRRSTNAKVSSPSTAPPAGLLWRQQAKFDQDIAAVKLALPRVSQALTNIGSSEYALFLHAWLIVNSRCFYYIPEGRVAPEDSDEAMALCPAVDLFNHTDGADGECDVTHDDDGFTVKVSQDRKQGYGEGEEVFVSYGGHGNDMLWVEYGFLLDQNKWDSVTIPAEVVLAGLSSKTRERIEEKGYLGDYTIGEEGVCWRTQVVGWLGEVTGHKWEELVDGLWVPEDDEDGHVTNGASDRIAVVIYRDTPRRRVMRKVVGWVLEVRQEVENSLVGMLSMAASDVAEVFGEDKAVATHRFDMTLKRWKQIWEMCMAALRSLELDCAGSFVVPAQAGRTPEDLETKIDDFIDGIRRTLELNEKHLPR